MAIDKITSAAITDGTITSSDLASGVVQNQSAFKNIIINGGMDISQRGTSFTGLTNGSSDYTVDRFKFNESGSMTSVFTFSQDTDVPTGQGFAKSLKIQNTTAGSGHNVVEAIQFIEAQNLQYLKFGTSSAENLILSFWVKCSETGTGNVSIYNLDATRQIAKNYTINSANTWEKKTLSIPGDTSGSFNNDNGTGLGIYFALAASSGYNGGTPGSWGSYSDGLRGAGMTIDLTNSTSDNIYITGIQLEAGTSASDFEFLPFDINLARCHRYCYVMGASANAENGGQFTVGSGMCRSSGSAIFTDIVGSYPQPLRTLPSLTQVGGDLADIFCYKTNGTSADPSSISIGRNTIALRVTNNMGLSSGLTAGDATVQQIQESDTDLVFDAEL